jgi:DedD protein
VERRVQERLVGAAVLMAAAIILIPEMLSGPRRGERAVTAQPSSDAPLKTYTIDLNRSPGAASSTGVDERAPPPEVNPSASSRPSVVETTPVEPSENPTSTPQAVPEGNALPQESQERIVSESLPRTTQPTAPRTQSTSPRESNPPAIASAPAAPTSRGWAVQLGSFASRATADGMVKDLSQQGQNAFVMPVKSGGSTLYRVRIGPFTERAAANEALREVKGSVANAAVVAHP